MFTWGKAPFGSRQALIILQPLLGTVGWLRGATAFRSSSTPVRWKLSPASATHLDSRLSGKTFRRRNKQN